MNKGIFKRILIVLLITGAFVLFPYGIGLLMNAGFDMYVRLMKFLGIVIFMGLGFQLIFICTCNYIVKGEFKIPD